MIATAGVATQAEGVQQDGATSEGMTAITVRSSGKNLPMVLLHLHGCVEATRAKGCMLAAGLICAHRGHSSSNLGRYNAANVAMFCCSLSNRRYVACIAGVDRPVEIQRWYGYFGTLLPSALVLSMTDRDVQALALSSVSLPEVKSAHSRGLNMCRCSVSCANV